MNVARYLLTRPTDPKQAWIQLGVGAAIAAGIVVASELNNRRVVKKYEEKFRRHLHVVPDQVD